MVLWDRIGISIQTIFFDVNQCGISARYLILMVNQLDFFISKSTHTTLIIFQFIKVGKSETIRHVNYQFIFDRI